MTYDLTILCIMRDSLGYLDRCIAQVNSAFEHYPHCHFIVCEGDSADGTKQRLAQIAADGDTEVRGDVTVCELDLNWTTPRGNVNHPSRWRQLEAAWNECLKHLEPTRYAVCVESDLIWTPDILNKMIAHLEAGRGDVMLPMLMRDTPVMGHYFYDINAFRLNGVNFSNYPPLHPDFRPDEQGLLQLDTGGGMLVMKGETLSNATWKNQCVLHYAEGKKVVCDTRSEILHP